MFPSTRTHSHLFFRYFLACYCSSFFISILITMINVPLAKRVGVNSAFSKKNSRIEVKFCNTGITKKKTINSSLRDTCLKNAVQDRVNKQFGHGLICLTIDVNATALSFPFHFVFHPSPPHTHIP